jgi:hypothetical protein
VIFFFVRAEDGSYFVREISGVGKPDIRFIRLKKIAKEPGRRILSLGKSETARKSLQRQRRCRQNDTSKV